MIKLTPEKPPYYTQGQQIKTYQALLTQTATDPPVPIILINTIGELVWAYTSPGGYTATLTNAFPENKTAILIGNTTGGIGSGARVSNDTISIQTLDAGTPADQLLDKTIIEIRVYN